MIAWLAPLFLLGALGVAIPILVHLVHRERKQPLPFPSLMFLRRVPFRSARRQRIRYWLLFLMRTAALLLVAAAFARPWLKRPQSAAALARGGKDIVVLIDRSWSMSARGVWQRALQEARNAVSIARPNDRVAVVGFDEQAQVLARLDEPRTRAQAALGQLQPSDEATRFAPAFKAAGTLLTQSRGPAEIVLITDRQRSGWRGIEQVAVPANTRVRVVDVRAAQVRDIALAEPRLTASSFAGRTRVVPAARVLNRSAAPASVKVELRVNGRVQQVRELSVGPNQSAPVQFAPMFADAGAAELHLASSDDLSLDDVVYFTTDAHAATRVRLVTGRPDARFYFASALTAADAGSDIRQIDRITARDLQDCDVLVLLDAPLPSGKTADLLETFVRDGGGLVIAGTVPQARGELWPLQDGRVVEQSDAPAALVGIEQTHPIFSAFRGTGDEPFANARVTRYLRSEPAADVSVLARFDDGAPAIVERRLGRGRIVAVPTGFTRADGDLVLQPAFVPFADQLIRYVAAGARVERSYTVGALVDVNSLVSSERDAVVVTPARQRVRLSPARGARTLRLSEPGIYQVRGGAAARTELIAANVDISEADLTPVDAKLFADAVTPRRNAMVAAAAVPLSAAMREQQQSIWWKLLVIAFVLFLAETLLANRISSAWRR